MSFSKERLAEGEEAAFSGGGFDVGPGPVDKATGLSGGEGVLAVGGGVNDSSGFCSVTGGVVSVASEAVGLLLTTGDVAALAPPVGGDDAPIPPRVDGEVLAPADGGDNELVPPDGGDKGGAPNEPDAVEGGVCGLLGVTAA